DAIEPEARSRNQCGTVVGCVRSGHWNYERAMPRGMCLSDGRDYSVVTIACNVRKRSRLVTRGSAEHLIDRRIGELAENVEHRHLKRCQRGGRDRKAAPN